MRSLARLLAIIVLPGFLLPAPAAPQQTQPSATFTSRSDLVLVPVHVRRKGEHVAGLKKEAFTVLQDGQPQPIASFEEVRTTTERLQRAQVATGQFTNRLEGNLATARYTVIAIDRVNTTTMDMIRLRSGLMKFLTQATSSGEPIRLVAINMSSIEILQDFTTNPSVLAAALERARTPAGRETPAADPSNNDAMRLASAQAAALASNSDVDNSGRIAALLSAAEDRQIQAQREATYRDRSSRISSLEALQAIAMSLSGLPGRKSVVWASSGYPFTGMISSDSKNLASGMGTAHNLSGVLEAIGLDEYTTHLLNSGNIALYPVDARGTVNTAFQVMDPSLHDSPSFQQKEMARQGNADIITTFENLASATGGKSCYERTDLSGCFKDAMDDARDYYMVGYYINRDKLQPGWHKLAVKVEEKGTSVRSRGGFLLTKMAPEALTKMDIGVDLGSRMINPGLPFTGRWTSTATGAGDKKIMDFEVNLPSSDGVVTPEQTHLNLEIAALARRVDGTVAAQVGQHLERSLPAEAIAAVQQEGITYRNKLELAPGVYMVRFVIRDNMTGRIGSVSTPLKVQ
jgi:VWFA-related protein